VKRAKPVTDETLDALRERYGKQLAERAEAAAKAGDEDLFAELAVRSVSVLSGAGDPGSKRPRERTKAGTPCEVCGKPLTSALLDHAPWATTCNQPCFMTHVVRSMPAWQLAADRVQARRGVA
jgi:hypothetical protein